MQEKISNNAIFILNRLKSAHNFKTDLELSDFLGVKQNTISSWKSRGTIDYDLIISKCDNDDLNWLLKGKEPSHAEFNNTACKECASKDMIITMKDQIISKNEEIIATKNQLIVQQQDFLNHLKQDNGELNHG